MHVGVHRTVHVAVDADPVPRGTESPMTGDYTSKDAGTIGLMSLGPEEAKNMSIVM